MANNEKEFMGTPVSDRLLNQYNLETYLDYADMADLLARACVEALREEETDDITVENLCALNDLLRECSRRFVDCDPYYRRTSK